jgi:transposase
MITRVDLAPDEIARLCAQAPPAVAELLMTLLDALAQQEDLLAAQAQTLASQAQLLTDQAATIATLTAQVQTLTDQQSRTSHNSHQPPASDGFHKQPRSLRRRSGKRPGGQPGHPGQTLTFAAAPDQIVLHRPSHCDRCGTGLVGLPAQARQRRQVVDLPPLQLQTTEHQVETLCCPVCQHLSSGQFPPEAPDPLQYGPRLKAFIVYLRVYQLLPSARTQELLADLFGAAPSEGTLTTILTAAATRLAPVVATIRAGVRQAAVAHFDETGCYVENKRYWLHVACTATLTYYAIHAQRGRQGSTAAGVLPDFRGIAVHDGYAAYWAYECGHALCNAHLLRELLFLVERYQQGWAQELADLLREMLAATQAAHAAGAAVLPAEQVTAFATRYAELVAAGLAANPVQARPPDQPRGRVKQSAATNLLLRLQEHGAEVLRFLHDLRVPFDNNQAERDVRMMKVQQKISGRFRTVAGAEAFCAIRSYISTLRKQGRGVREALEQTFRGTPLLPSIPG